MIKQDIVDNVANATGLTKVEVEAVLNESFSEIIKALSNNEKIELRGFGTFKAKKRAKKTGRNIKKNTTIIIPEHHIPSFKPAKSFVQEVKNNRKHFLISMSSAVIWCFLVVLHPYLIKRIVDDGIVANNRQIIVVFISL